MNVIDLAKLIHFLHQTFHQHVDSAEECAKKINDVLIFGEKVPHNLLIAAWDLYAQKNGVES